MMHGHHRTLHSAIACLLPLLLLLLLGQVVFLHPKDNDGVLMELEEVGPKS
jgi:hypothetical protein